MMFRPEIIGFICKWNLPTEERATSHSIMYGCPKIHIVRVMCVGGIDPVIFLETFAKGVDGVLVIGCHPPDCHYTMGNLQAERKIKATMKLISLAGLEKERLHLDWTYGHENQRLAKIIEDFRKKVATLGPSPWTSETVNPELLLNINAAKATTEDFRLRLFLGREKELTESENAYGEKILQKKFDLHLYEILESEFARHKIRLLTKKRPMSVKELAAVTHMKPALVLRHVMNMRRKGMMTLDRVKVTSPLYKALEVQ